MHLGIRRLKFQILNLTAVCELKINLTGITIQLVLLQYS